MKYYTKKLVVFSMLFLFTQLFSQTEDDFIKEFVKGSVVDKTQLLSSVNLDGNSYSNLLKTSFKFINDNYSLLSNDKDFISLARTSIQKSSQNSLTSLLPQLKDLFALTNNTALKLDLLTVFSAITVENSEIVSLVNDYAQTLLSENEAVNNDMLFLTLEVLGNFANASSFPVLFHAYAYSNDKAISKIAFDSLSKIPGGNENQVRALIEQGNSVEKYYTLLLVLNNPNNSDFFRAEMSEKALSSSIISIGDVSLVDDYIIDLQMAAIRELSRISWTRSADLITDFYLFAKDEYEAGILSEDNFSEIIRAFSVLSSGNAGDYLAEYLEKINRQQEENSAYSEAIVLTVIQSLGLLGNKVAFDALLYTTYLDYPENIILAARDALVTLKW